MARIGGYAKYSFAVMDDRNDAKLYITKTEKDARKYIIGYYSVSPNTARHLWVVDYYTHRKIGIINEYGKYGGGLEYTYETTSGSERRVNKDGTYVKKRKSDDLNGLGLDMGLKW